MIWLVALTEWLRHPRIELSVTPSEKVQRLQSEIEGLQSQVDDMQVELQRVQRLYAQECAYNLSLEDELRALGVRRRR